MYLAPAELPHGGLDYRTTFLRFSLQRTFWPEPDDDGDPARDILALQQLRGELRSDWQAAWKEHHGVDPTVDEEDQFRRNVQQITGPRDFFYEFSGLNLYRQVEVVQDDNPTRTFADLPALLADLAARIDHTGVLLATRSGAGKTVAMWKSLFDCFHPDPGSPAAKLAGCLPVWLRITGGDGDTLSDLLRERGSLDEVVDGVTEDLIIDLLALSAGMTPRSEAEWKVARHRVQDALRYGPPLLMLIDLNHADQRPRRLVARALRKFRERNFREQGDWQRHRIVAVYRSTDPQDATFGELLARGSSGTEIFRRCDLRPLRAPEAESYLRTFRDFETRCFERLNAGLRDVTLPIPQREIDEECRTLKELIRRSVRPPSTVRVDEPAPASRREVESLISTPLLMNWVAALRGEALQQVRTVTHLFREMVQQHLERERRSPDYPQGVNTDDLQIGMVRLALVMVTAGVLRLPLRNCRSCWLHPQNGANMWWLPNGLLQENPWHTQALEKNLLPVLLRHGLLRREGDQIRFLHDSLVNYFAAVALQEYLGPSFPAPGDAVADTWPAAVGDLFAADPQRWEPVAGFLGGGLIPQPDESKPSITSSVEAHDARRLVVELLLRSFNANLTGVLRRFAGSAAIDPVLRQVEQPLLDERRVVDEHPNAVFGHVHNHLAFFGSIGSPQSRLGAELKHLYDRLPKPRPAWLRQILGSRRSSVQTMADHSTQVECVTVHPDGRIISGSVDRTVRVWNSDDGIVQSMDEHTDAVTSVAAHPDGRIISGSHDNTVKVWNLDSRTVRTMDEHTDAVTSVAVHPDGRIVSGARDHTVKLWDPDEGTVQTFHDHTSWVECVTVHPDGRIVSGSRDHTVRVWDPNEGIIQTLYEHTSRVKCVAVHPDGRIVSGSRDHTVKLWNPDDGTVQTMDEHTGLVQCVAVHPDGRIVSGSHDSTVKVWNPDDGTVRTMDEHTIGVTCVAVHPDGRIVSGSDDNTVKVWNPDDGMVRTMDEHTDSIECVVAHPDGRIVSGNRDHTVKAWNPDEGFARAVDEHSDSVECVAVYTDGRIVSASWDHTVKIWNPDDGTVQTMNEHSDSVVCVAVHPDGWIVSGSYDGTVKLWNPDNGAVHTTGQHAGWVSCVMVHPDGRLVSASWDHTVKVWDLQDGTVCTMDEHFGSVECLAVHPDGRIISGSHDGTVRVWNPVNGIVRTMAEHHGSVVCVSVHPDGWIVSGCRDGIVKVWNPDDGTVYTMDEHSDSVECVAVHPDGRIVSGSADGIMMVWHPTERVVETAHEYRGSVQCIAVHPDGRILSSGREGLLIVHGLDLTLENFIVLQNAPRAISIHSASNLIAIGGSNYVTAFVEEPAIALDAVPNL